MQAYINFSMVGICLALIIFVLITDSLSKKRKVLLIMMTLSTIALIVSGSLAEKYDGSSIEIEILIAKISKFFDYAANLSIIYFFTLYLKDLLKQEGKVEKIPISLRISDIIIIIGLVMLSLSQSIGFYYTYDERNIYHRSSGNIISYIFPVAAIVILIITIIRYRHKLRKRLFLPLLLFTAVPPILSVMHYFSHDFNLADTSIVGMIVILYCFSILDANDLAKIAHEKESELVKQTAFALAEAIDAKDSYTNGHSRRVAEYSVEIAKKAGKNAEELDKLYLIALLHDVGKIGIPGSIINKKGKLTNEEYASIKTHPTIGREILSKIAIMPDLAIGASFHHERYDGKGYPYGLKGDEIPELARIIAVADTYDAMASKRSYRDSLTKNVIKEELLKGVGTQFDPNFAKIMVDLIGQS